MFKDQADSIKRLRKQQQTLYSQTSWGRLEVKRFSKKKVKAAVMIL
jgi:hypothetical protein